MIPDEMMRQLQSLSFRNRYLRKIGVLCKQANNKLTTDPGCYKGNFDRTFQRIPKFSPGPRVLIDRLPVQVTKFAYGANASKSKLLSKMVVRIKVISATPDTVTVDANGIHNTLFGDWATVPRSNEPKDDVKD